MTKTTSLAAALALAALVHAGGATGARAQTPVPDPIGPADLDRTQFRASARALGMGGADLILFGDASGAAFNPASIAFAGRGSEANTVTGRTSNVHVNKINDLSRGLKDLGNQFNNSNSSLAGVRDAVAKVYGFATDAGARGDGSPATLSASVSPLVGASVGSVGVVAYGGLMAKVQIRPYSQATLGTNFPGLGTQSGAVTAAYGVLGLTNIAVPFSIKTPAGPIGLAPRYVQASYAGAGFLANETSTANGFDPNGLPNGDIAGATYRETNTSKVDLDAGFISNPDPVYHIRGAVVVHNLFSPSFHLARRINSSLGALPAGGDFSFQMKPQIDLGGRTTGPGVTYAAEVHNVNSVNGGRHTVHLGVEVPVTGAFSVRGGYDASRFVVGVGVGTRAFRLDVATGANPQEQVALSLTFAR